MSSKALSGIRIADFTGQLSGAGATRFLSAFGAQVIRIENPANGGVWDNHRRSITGPYVDERRGTNLSTILNNHSVEKLGITINLANELGKEVFRLLVAQSDVVTENFSAGVLARHGFAYETLREIKKDIIYVSNSGFGHVGPYASFKTYGPTVQAFSGLTFTSGLPGQPPAGWGYSYMDHTGAYYMTTAILAALHHRHVTGEGQWVDCATTDEGVSLNGPALLDYTVNGRPTRSHAGINSNRSQWPPMAPHGIYPAAGEDAWVAIACRDEDDWQRFADVVGQPWTSDARFATLSARKTNEDALDALVAAWTKQRGPFETQPLLRDVGVPCSAVQTPEQRIDHDANTKAWGLWPIAEHPEIGRVPVDGIPAHLSESDWQIERGGPCLGEHNDYVFGEILGLSAAERAELHEAGAI